MDKELSTRIRNEYIRKGARVCDLARKYGVNDDAIRRLEKKEDWKRKREEYARKREEKTIEKIADQDSEVDADISRMKGDIRLELFRQISARLKREDMDEADFRRLTQCFKDMCELDSERSAVADDRLCDDPLSASLRALAEGLNDADQ